MYKNYSKLSEIYGKTFEELREEWRIQLNNSLNFEYILGPNEFKIAFFDSIDVYKSQKRSFAETLGSNTYEYVDCGLARNKDDEKDPNANDFKGINVKGKIALIQQIPDGAYDFSKQIANVAEAGVIVYSDYNYYISTLLESITEDIPAISISTEYGEFLKEALDKKITADENFIGIIDNDSL